MNNTTIQALKTQGNQYFDDYRTKRVIWLEYPTKRIVEAEQTVDIANSELLKLKEKFQTSTDYKEIGYLVREISDSTSTEKLRILHELLQVERDDYKRACLLQILAELGDNKSIKTFLDEIKNLAKLDKDTIPTLSQVVALTYIRYLPIPKEEIKNVIKNIIKAGNNRINLDFERKTNFIVGAIVTLGSISQLDESANFILRFLKYNELDTVEEALDSISEIWQRTERNQKEEVLNQYRERITKQLYLLIEEHCLNISKTISISPHKRIISRAISLLAKVDPGKLSKELLQKLLIVSIEENSTYLRTAVLDALFIMPNDKLLDILNFKSR